jgi:putative transposase
VDLHALTLMANHVHAILRPPGRDALAHAIKSTAQRYAVYRNRRRGSSGKLFEQRYHSIPILTDEYLSTVTCYNDLNAVRAGIVDDPFAYPWSTYALHAGRPDACSIPSSMWTPSAWYLSLGGDGAGRAARFAETALVYVEHSLPERHAAIVAAAEALSLATARPAELRPDLSRAE